MFCPTCKGLMRPVGGKLACAKCATTTSAGPSLVVKAAAQDREMTIVDVEKDRIATLPTTDDDVCEKCNNTTAYYYFRQTRAADEATTRFLECTKCGYKWRDYR